MIRQWTWGRQQVFETLMVAAVSLVCFRFVIFGYFGNPASARIFLPLPLIVAFFWGYRKLLFPMPLLAFALWAAFCALALFSAFNSGASLSELLPILGGTLGAFIFLMFILSEELSAVSLKSVLGKAFKLVVVLGGSWNFFEFYIYKSRLMYPWHIQAWLLPKSVIPLVDGGIDHLAENRLYGIMGEPAISALLLATCTIYLVYSDDFIRNRRVQLLSLMGFLAVLLNGSLLISIFLATICLYKAVERIRSGHKYAPVLAVVLLAGIVPFSPVGERVPLYFKNWQNQTANFLPKLTDCAGLGFFSSNIDRNFCSHHEYHFFEAIFHTGILPYGFYLFVLFAFVSIILLNFKKVASESKAELAAICLMFLSVAHYGGPERWGPNFIFLLLLAVIFKNLFGAEVTRTA
jgi:hypothetical protein